MGEKMTLFGAFNCDPLFFYEAVARSTDDYIFIIDMEGSQSLVSENMCQDFDLPGRLVEDLVPRWTALIHEKDRPAFLNSMQQMMDGISDEHRVEYQIRNRAGEYVWVHCQGYLQRDEAGQPMSFAGAITNLSTKGKVDAVTGLFGQQECERWVSDLVERGKQVALLLLGIDDFTKINDLRGHAFGDAVLRKFAQEVQAPLPLECRIYRFDGDGFSVVCEGAHSDALREVYRRVQRYSARSHAVDGIAYFCSVSGGIAALSHPGEGYTDLVRNAASALDDAKRGGRNRCVLFRPEFILPKLRSLEFSEQLHACVMGGMRHFEVVYQPFVRADTLALSGAEALLRWSDDDGKMVSPAEFIPLLEAGSMMIPVGRWVLDRAVRQCARWLKRCPDFILNVNVSFLQMQDPAFVPAVKGILAEAGFPPHNLVLELTESRFVTDREILDSSFRALREAGVRVAMDDFGTGYSSLGMLAQCPADIVKIDRAFIDHIDDERNQFNLSFIGAVIQLCHSVGITVCVEGVEQEGELETVRALGADSIQGYFISKPLHPAALRARLTTLMGESSK